MSALDQIISVQITAAPAAVSEENFSIVLIVGPTNPGWQNGDKIRTYSDASGLLADGYTTTSPEYIAASAVFGQSITPSVIKVGIRSPGAAQVDTFMVNTLTVGHVYSLKVGSTTASYTAQTGDTQASVLNALSTQAVAAGGLSGAVSGTGATTALALTATTAGTSVNYSAIDSFLTRVVTTAASGIAQDLAAMAQQDNTFYGVAVSGANDQDIMQIAAWCQANKKLYSAVTSTAAAAQTGTTDVLSNLKAAAYDHVMPSFRAIATPQGFGAAYLSKFLAQTPGSASACYIQLSGISADTLTDAQRAVLIGNPVAGIAGKNANIYTTLGGVNVTQTGVTASGKPVDLVLGTDWLTSGIQTDVFALLASLPKLPYTDAGMALVQNVILARLKRGAANGFLDEKSLKVTVPTVLSVSQNQRAQRISPTFRFEARCAGAISNVVIQGSLSV